MVDSSSLPTPAGAPLRRTIWWDSLDWFDEALCAQIPESTDLFFPEKNDTEGRAHMAKKICALCLIREACLEYALEKEMGTGGASRAGVWGRLSPGARYRLARARDDAASQGGAERLGITGQVGE